MNKIVRELKRRIEQLESDLDDQRKLNKFLSYDNNKVIITDRFMQGICLVYPIVNYIKNGNLIELCLPLEARSKEYKLIMSDNNRAIFEMENAMYVINKDNGTYCSCPKDLFKLTESNVDSKKKI